jgi:hypothetical protein
MRDKVKTEQLSSFNLNSTYKALALVPGLVKYIVLNNPNVQ